MIATLFVAVWSTWTTLLLGLVGGWWLWLLWFPPALVFVAVWSAYWGGRADGTRILDAYTLIVARLRRIGEL